MTRPAKLSLAARRRLLMGALRGQVRLPTYESMEHARAELAALAEASSIDLVSLLNAKSPGRVIGQVMSRALAREVCADAPDMMADLELEDPPRSVRVFWFSSDDGGSFVVEAPKVEG